MVRWGNGKANVYWEHELSPNFEPPESYAFIIIIIYIYFIFLKNLHRFRNIDAWIRSKYDRKQFAMKTAIPDPDTIPLPDGVVASVRNIYAYKYASSCSCSSPV